MLALPSIPNNNNTNNNMENELPSHEQNHANEVQVPGQKAKRTKSPGVRVVGIRIYDSANGKTCHQCRQKTTDLAASCKNLKAGKPCPIRFCLKCLLNRYGEKAAEVELLNNWSCPKCRGICNCSCCRKRQGLVPTGPLAHTAKLSGFKSVSDMLQNVNNVAVSSMEEATVKKEQMIVNKKSSCDSNDVSLLKPLASDKHVLVDILSGEAGKENSLDGNNGFKLDSLKDQKSPEKSKKVKQGGLKEISNGNSFDDACENRSPKRSKICNDVPEEEAKENANDGIKLLHEVSEKEMKVPRSCDIVYGETDGPEKWAENDFFFNPMTLAPKDFVFNPVTLAPKDFVVNPVTLAPRDYLFNPNQYDVKEEMHGKNWKGTEVSDDDENAGIKKIQEVPLPPGIKLTDILEIEFPPEDVGNALQFLEFCRVFGKALEIKKGEPVDILREMVRKQSLRRGEHNLSVQFLIRLLTVILIDSGIKSPSLTNTNGKNSWLKALENLISGSVVLKEFPLDWLEEGIGGYFDLDISKKLSLLNFLCDEALGTEKLRNYIDDQNSIFADEVKEAKSKVAAAKEKEKCLKQKLHDEMVKSIASKGSISEHDALFAKIKSETEQAHAELLEAKGKIPNRKQSSDATRIDPLFSDDSGQTFWQLKSYPAEQAVLLQDIKVQEVDGTAADEKWFVYDLEQKDEIDKYISSRAKGPKAHKVSYIPSNESSTVIV